MLNIFIILCNLLLLYVFSIRWNTNHTGVTADNREGMARRYLAICQHVSAICCVLVGFDPKGREELNGKLVGTKKWIGTTEVAALLRYLRIR